MWLVSETNLHLYKTEFGSPVPLQKKRYVIEGTVCRVFRSTSTKNQLNEALGAD